MRHILIASLLLFAGCGDDGGTGDPDAGMMTIDSGGPMDASMPVDTGMGDPDADPTAGCIPSEPYGTAVGRNFAPWSLPNCADDSSFEFYNADYCASDTKLTVVSIAAGWCGPCINETMQLTEQITNMYGPRGVRVIQAVVQKEDYSAPDLAYCQAWVTRFGLVNTEVYDTMGTLQRYFPDNALPSTLIIDKMGVIRFRENGASMGLITLRGALDRLLAETP